jgi:hypothetical protein
MVGSVVSFQLTSSLDTVKYDSLNISSHKKNFSWSVPLYSQWQASIKEQRPIPDDNLPSWKESLPFARRKITVHNLHPPVSGLTFDRLQRFQGSINGGKFRVLFVFV